MHRSASADDAGHDGCRSRAMLFVLDSVVLMAINNNRFHSGVFIYLLHYLILFLLLKPIEQATARIDAADPPAVLKGIPLPCILLSTVLSSMEIAHRRFVQTW